MSNSFNDSHVPENQISTKKVNYLNNKDILKEIHASKTSFSEFVDQQYSDYDIIVENIQDIFLTDIQEKAKSNRASRLAARAFENAIQTTPSTKPKLADFKIKPENINVDDLVFRVLTYEHIPLSPGRKKTPKSLGDNYVKLNFAPFKHFIIKDGQSIEVGRSHSKNGKFSVDHGSITNKLANMFILMVNKYAQRGNWRGYCVDASTVALTDRGWVGIDNINTNDRIVSYNGKNLVWSSIKSVYTGTFNGKMHHLQADNFDSFITPNHKITTTEGLVPVELLQESAHLQLLADSLDDNNELYSNDTVKLIGHFILDGTFDADKNAVVFNGSNVEKIKHLLGLFNFTFSNYNNTLVVADADFVNFIKLVLPNKDEFSKLLVLLSTQQRSEILRIITDNCAEDNKTIMFQNRPGLFLDSAQALCAMLGLRSTYRHENNSGNNYHIFNILESGDNVLSASKVNFNGGLSLNSNKLLYPNTPTVEYNGRVWCPETEFGCFVAKRNNTVYLTGNTYLDEMKGQALLQLAQTGLQFDEMQSNNPFSFYTMFLQNSFTRVFNLEKKNQDLRDDLLIDNGASPSFSRQLAINEEIRRLREDAQESSKDYND